SPLLPTMMGMPLEGKHKERVAGIEGEALEKLILKNLRDLITAAAVIRPLIILIEDLHWADTSSITFLESLFKLVKKNQILFINVFRPGHKETGDFIQEFLNENLQEDHITIKINPLIETESRKLIGNLLHNSSLPSEVCEMIIRKTEGNPFFIEEVIRSFIDDGIIEIKGNEFFITEKIHQANIPENINEVILSRVDKLDEKTKDLLKTASVIGRNFYYKVLEEAADTIGELDDRIEYLKDVQLIGESKQKEEIEFLFKHALAQQATYESIIQNTKKELHQKIARSIEKVFTENLHEHYGSLAYHYGKAENTEKTEEYLIKAGDEAMESGASTEAIGFFNKALKTLHNNPEPHIKTEKINQLEEKLAFVYLLKGMNREVVELTSRILPRYGFAIRQYGYAEKLVVIFFAIRIMFFLSRYERVKKRPPTDKEIRIIKLFFCRGYSLITINPTRYIREMLGHLFFARKIDVSKTFTGSSIWATPVVFFTVAGVSFRTSEKALALSKKYLDRKNIVSWVTNKEMEMVHNAMAGKWESDPEQEEFIKACISKGQFFEASIYLLYAAYSYIEKGEFRQAMHLVDTMLDIGDKYENSNLKAESLKIRTLFYLKIRKMDRANETGKEVLGFIKETGHAGFLFAMMCTKAQLQALTGEIEEAAALILKAEESLSKIGRFVIWRSKFFLVKSYVFMKLAKHEKDNKKRNEYWSTSLKASKNAIKSSKMVAPKAVEANRLRAIILWENEKNKAAFKSFKTTIKIGESFNARLELSRTYFELGKFLSDPKTKYNELNGHSVSHYLEKARAMFKDMDLQWDLVEYREFVKKV
ncbi:MAG: hypothetical protein K8R74_06975, partial [Bacteroidales bacterium]|nr:hypothetical protein [Bacteroidales bacterium]